MIPKFLDDGTFNPFSIEQPTSWDEIRTLLEIHGAGATEYDREMRGRAIRTLLSWAETPRDKALLEHAGELLADLERRKAIPQGGGR